MLPSVGPSGDLPVGVHRATLQEVGNRFGDPSEERQLLFNRLCRIYNLASQTGHLARFVVFGSFVTDKPAPNDVDVLLVFDESFDASVCDAKTLLLLDHSIADAHFGASVFWLRRPAAFGGEDGIIEFWQKKTRWYSSWNHRNRGA